MTPDEYWESTYGGQPKQTAPAPVVVPAPAPVAAPASDPFDYWERTHGGGTKPQAVKSPIVAAPVSTPMEDRAMRASAAGKKLWNVNESYNGEIDKARAQYNDLLAHGATPKEALFLTSAAASESNFNPTAVHDKGTGYGMYGHRLDRLDAMRKFTGAQWPSQSEQNAYALHELRNSPTAALARQTLANAQDARQLAIAQMHYERPQGYSQNDPTAGLNFAGRLGTVNKFTSLMGDHPEIHRQELAPEWGAMQSAASGMTLGFGPQIRAGYKALRYGKPYDESLADLRRQEAYYKERNPLFGYGAEVLGTMMPVSKGMQIARPFVEAGMTAAAPYVAPGVARGLAQVGRFLGGEAGQAVPLGEEAMPGVAGFATRVGSTASQGATQAAGQTALEQGSQLLGGSLGDQETPVLRQFGQNMAMGGVLGAGLSRFMQPGKAFSPEWEAGARDIGRAAFDQGVPVYPGQFAKGAAREFFEQAIPKSALDEQVKVFSQKAAQKVGAENLSLKALEKAERVPKSGYDAFEAAVGPMRPATAAMRKLVDAYNEAFTLRDPAMQRTVQNAVQDIANDIASGSLTGKVYRKYVQTGGPIDTKLLGLENPLKRRFGGMLREALDALVEANNPAEFETLKKVNAHYRDIQTLKKVAQDSGIANPKAVMKAVTKKGSSTDLPTLARAGQFMPGVTPAGEAIVGAGTHSPESLKKLARYGMYGAGGYLATENPAINAILEAGGPLTKAAGNVARAVLAGATASELRQARKAKVMAKPEVRKQIFEETYGPNRRALGRQAVRPLMHGSVEYNPLFGDGK